MRDSTRYVQLRSNEDIRGNGENKGGPTQISQQPNGSKEDSTEPRYALNTSVDHGHRGRFFSFFCGF